MNAVTKPDSRPTPEQPPPSAGLSTRTLVLTGLLVCLIIAGVVSYFASSSPDGLEFVAGHLGFEDAAKDSATSGSPLADYSTRGVGHSWFSGGLAGVIGVAVTAALAFGLMWVLRRRNTRG